jgi:hypothetical protein
MFGAHPTTVGPFISVGVIATFLMGELDYATPQLALKYPCSSLRKS